MYFNDRKSPFYRNSVHPTDAQDAFTYSNYVIEASSIANNSTPLDFFKYSTYLDDTAISLPQGWKLTQRKRSIFELDTNIHTLGELYNSLVDLRNQLPDPVAMEVEMPFNMKEPRLLTARSSTDDIIMTYRSRSGSSNMDTTSPPLSPREADDDTRYDRLLYVYPDFIFEALMCSYLECISFPRVHPERVSEQHSQGRLNKAYACAIYAYASLHAILCHPEKYGIYSFMNQLSHDAYQIAFELVEFDAGDVTTIETLVVMSQYLAMIGREGEAKNLFCLAQRHISLLNHVISQDTHRLFVWMTELDWIFALTRLTTPIIQYDQVKASLKHLKACSSQDELYIKAVNYKIKGLRIALSGSDQVHQRLNQWRSKYLEWFLYKRVATQPYTSEDKHALRLHAIYFAGMLEIHKQRMLSGFDDEDLFCEESTVNWTDYFHQSETKQSHHTKVEKGLYRSMSAAYGFIQVIRLLLDEKDRCILPQMIDTLSTACTVLYFGNKVVISDRDMIEKSKEALSFVVQAFFRSTTYATVECPRVDIFIKKWKSVIM